MKFPPFIANAASAFDFGRDFKRTGTMDALVNGYSNPDLRNYKAAGGKLIVIQGWEDSGHPGPLVAVDYYEMAERIIGDREATQDFFRLLTSAPDQYLFSRPHYPYPLWAKYKGSGDPNDYRSFEPIDPETQ